MNYIGSSSRRQVTPPPNRDLNPVVQKSASLVEENLGLQSTLHNIKQQSNILKVLNKDQSDQYAYSLALSNKQLKGQISGIEEKLQSLRKDVITPVTPMDARNSRRAEVVDKNRSETPNQYDSNIRIIQANSITPQHQVKDLNQINAGSFDDSSPFHFSNQNSMRLHTGLFSETRFVPKSQEVFLAPENATDSEKVLALTRENQRLKEQLRVSDLSIQNVGMIEENSRLKTRIAELESQTSGMPARDDGTKLQPGQNQSLLKDLRRLNEDNNSLYDDNKQLLRENKQLRKKIEEYSMGGLEDVSKENVRLKEQVKQLDEERQLLQKKLQQKADSSHLLNMISDKDIKISELEENLKLARQNLQARNSGVQNAQFEIENLNRELQSRISMLEKELVQKNQAIEQFTKESEIMKSKSQYDTAKIAELEAMLTQSQKNIQSSTAQLENRNFEINRLEKQLKNVGSENHGIHHAFEDAKIQISQLTDQIEELQGIIQELRFQNSQLEQNRKELHDQNSLLENHHHQLIERENVIGQLKKEVLLLQ